MKRFKTFHTEEQTRRVVEGRRLFDATRRRETETRRLYGTQAWRRLALAHLAREPLCVLCEAGGVTTAATVCDHVVPHRGDVEAFWSGPFQSLCKQCHDSAKAKEEGGLAYPAGLMPSRVPLTIVCGPPGSGKTTWCLERATARSLIIDLDMLVAERFGQPGWMWDRARWLAPALARRNAMLVGLGRDGAAERWSEAFFVVEEPSSLGRQWWREHLKPMRVVVLGMPRDECVRRVAARPGMSPVAAAGLVDKWFDASAHRPTPTPLRGVG